MLFSFDGRVGLHKRSLVRIAEKAFRIAEVEAYLHSPHHADPYAHGDEGRFGIREV